MEKRITEAYLERLRPCWTFTCFPTSLVVSEEESRAKGETLMNYLVKFYGTEL